MAAIEITPLAPPPSTTPQTAPTGAFGGLRPLEIKPLTPLYDPSVAQKSLDQLKESQNEAMSAAATALTANTQIQSDLLKTQMHLQDDSMEAFDNLTRIQRWGDVSDILSLFSEKWSETIQSSRIKKNDMIVQQQSLRAQAAQALNNVAPSLASAKKELAEQDFKNQLLVFDVTSKVKGLEQQDMDLLIKRNTLLMDMSKEQRQQIELGAQALDIKGAKLALRDARAGKGEWVGFEGILEHKINIDEKAQLDRQNLELAVRSGNFDLQEKYQTSLAKKIPVTEAQALVLNAQATGQAVVNWRGAQLPVATVMDSLAENQKTEDAVNLSIMQSRNEVVGNLFNEVAVTATTLSSQDPRAAASAGVISRAFENVRANPGNPQVLANFHLLLKNEKTVLSGIAKTVASTYKSDEAKAAVIQLAETGKPSTQGARAVVQENMGNWGASSGGRYAPAMEILNVEYAKRIAELNLKGAPVLDGGTGSAMQMLSWFSGQTYKSTDRLREEVISDPAVRQKVGSTITGIIAHDTAMRAVETLANSENGDPVWKTLKNNDGLIQTDGGFDRQKLIRYLEQKTIQGGPNGIDYNSLFSDALRAEAMKASSQGIADPRYNGNDRFLEVATFGDNPTQAALGDFIVNYEADRKQSRTQAQKSIQEDVSGKTQRDTLIEAGVWSGLSGLPVDPKDVGGGIKKTPSATGAPLTADQVRTLYGGGTR